MIYKWTMNACCSKRDYYDNLDKALGGCRTFIVCCFIDSEGKCYSIDFSSAIHLSLARIEEETPISRLFF